MKTTATVLALLVMLVAGAIVAARPLDAKPSGAVRSADAVAQRSDDEGSRLGGDGSSNDAEIIVGTISCGPTVNGPDPVLALRFGGSIPLAQLGSGNQLVGITLPPEAPSCAEILQQGAERVAGLGCAAGPVEPYYSESFVCSSERTKLVNIMAKLSVDVLSGGF